jgi:ABC-type transport system involved in multi-copper enzyme maturation permease subunit
MMNLTDMLTVARAEIGATFRGRKGIGLVVTLLLIAGVPSLLRLWGQHSSEAAQLQRAHIAALVRIYDVAIARSLIDCPPALVVMALASFFFQPFIVLVAGADRLPNEIDSGSIRYLTARAPRTVILLGKAVGLWGVVTLATVGVQAAVAVIAVVDDPRAWVSTLGWTGAIMAFSSLTALVYVGLCLLVSVLFARPRLVLVTGLLLVFGLRFVRGVARARHADRLASLFPGALDQLFLSAGTAPKLAAVAVVAAWSALFLTAAAVLFRRRAV